MERQVPILNQEFYRYLLQAFSNAILSALWMWTFSPVFSYLSVLFTRQEFRTNQVLLAAILALLVYRAHQGRGWKELIRSFLTGLVAPPHFYLPALLLAGSASLFYLAAERFLDINTLSALLFGLATYGLLGLWLAPARWRAGLPAALLVILVLPFGEHMETFAGYPLRIASAAIVRDGLAGLGFPAVGIDTILVFENGISQVDIPCSGVKSLWTGAMFLLAATWIENRRINLRWLLVGLAMALLLFGANVLRVGVLALAGPVAGMDLLAELVHVPLGVLGFAAACAGALALLRRLPLAAGLQADAGQPAIQGELPRPAWLTYTLIAFTLALALLYRPHTPVLEAPTTSAWVFPAEFAMQPLPLSPQEEQWIVEGGAESAERARFSYHGLDGSLIFVSSTDWRGQHRPERCFEVYGLAVSENATYFARQSSGVQDTAGFPLRLLALEQPDSSDRLTAAYWFQSPGATTDDYGARIWADLAPQRERWVLVTVLFDRAVDPADSNLQAFFNALHAVVARGMKGGLAQ